MNSYFGWPSFSHSDYSMPRSTRLDPFGYQPSRYGVPSHYSYRDPFEESSFYECPSIYRRTKSKRRPTTMNRPRPEVADPEPESNRVDEEKSIPSPLRESPDHCSTVEPTCPEGREQNESEQQEDECRVEDLEGDDEVVGPKAEEVERRLTAIRNIDRNVEDQESRVEGFSGDRGSKEYLFISETLISQLLKLDEIQAEGVEEIRALRKSVVLKIERYLEQLEANSK